MQNAMIEKASHDRLWAVVMWFASVGATALFVNELGVDAVVAVVAGFLIQGLFTKIENGLWARDYSAIGFAVLAIDVYFNASGVYPLFRNGLGNTSAWAMAADVTQSGNPPNRFLMLGIAAVLGFILARGPEYLWNRRKS